jgi:hypothetical protein
MEAQAEWQQRLLEEVSASRQAASEDTRSAGEAASVERQRVMVQAQAQAERQQRLVEEVSTSLQAVSKKTQGLSAGSESVLNYEAEFELE